jgi:activator of 2-hydroxyglutaryl-CoA dehydratase
MLTVGLDLGSTTTKIAAVENGKLVATDMSFTGYNMEKAWRDIFAGLLDRQGINQSDIDCIVSTGYGRKAVGLANKQVTEMTCHAGRTTGIKQYKLHAT